MKVDRRVAEGDDTVVLRSIEIAPVTPAMYEELYHWSTDTQDGFRWRFGGGTPPPERFADALWAEVLCQFVAIDPSGRLHGLVVCYAADHQNGHAYFGVQGNPKRATGLGATVGLVKLLDHVFSHWDLRKLYAELPEYNAAEFSSALRRHARAEGTLRDHIYYNGRRWDQTIYAVYRDDWYRKMRPRYRRILGPCREGIDRSQEIESDDE